MAQKTHIDASRQYYDEKKVDLCKCTPPTSICTWGLLPGPWLRNRTDEKINLLERAAISENDQLKEKLEEMQGQSYCCRGFTSTAVKQEATEAFMGAAGDAGEAAAGMYSASLVMDQRNEIVGQSSDSLSSCLEAGWCGRCETCNDAYVVNDAANNFLTGKTFPVQGKTPPITAQPQMQPPAKAGTKKPMLF